MVDSSGLLLFRRSPDGVVEVLIGHMGGPFWANQQDHAWSVPKGLHDDGEDDHLEVALREFEEEMGAPPPDGPNIALGSVKTGNKTITVFAREGDFDAESAVSNTFHLEWPRGSPPESLASGYAEGWWQTAAAPTLAKPDRQVHPQSLPNG